MKLHDGFAPIQSCSFCQAWLFSGYSPKTWPKSVYCHNSNGAKHLTDKIQKILVCLGLAKKFYRVSVIWYGTASESSIFSFLLSFISATII